MRTITLVMYSSMNMITLLCTRVRVRLLKKYSSSSMSTSTEYDYSISGNGQSLPLGEQQIETSMKLYLNLFMNING